MSRQLIAQLNAALSLLAMSPHRQLEHVRQLGVGNDELALEFDDVAPARKRLAAEGSLSTEQVAAVVAVERQLSSISSAGITRWQDHAVLTGEDWKELRELAERALDAMRGTSRSS